MLFWFLMICLLIFAVAATPRWPHSRQWGYYPSGGIFLFLLILLMLWWMMWLPGWGAHPYWGGQ